jgi:hypothetical protein
MRLLRLGLFGVICNSTAFVILLCHVRKNSVRNFFVCVKWTRIENIPAFQLQAVVSSLQTSFLILGLNLSHHSITQGIGDFPQSMQSCTSRLAQIQTRNRPSVNKSSLFKNIKFHPSILQDLY